MPINIKFDILLLVELSKNDKRRYFMLEWLMRLFCCCIKTHQQEVFAPDLAASISSQEVFSSDLVTNVKNNIRTDSTDSQGFSKFIGE